MKNRKDKTIKENMNIFKLQDYIYFFLLRNFELLIDDPIFVKDLSHMPSSMLDKLFNGLNYFYGGLTYKILKFFTDNPFSFGDVILYNDNISFKSYIEDKKIIEDFLKNKKFKSLNLNCFTNIHFSYVLKNLNFDNLSKISINNCKMQRIVSNDFKDYLQAIDYILNLNARIENSCTLKNVRNLTVLNLFGLDVDDENFYWITKTIHSLEDVNISNTLITDIRLLKNQKNLRILNFIEQSENFNRNVIHLASFEKLESLCFGNKINKNKLCWDNEIIPSIARNLNLDEKKLYLNVPEIFRSKYAWDINEFLCLVSWKDLRLIYIREYDQITCDTIRLVTSLIKHKSL